MKNIEQTPSNRPTSNGALFFTEQIKHNYLYINYFHFFNYIYIPLELYKNRWTPLDGGWTPLDGKNKNRWTRWTAVGRNPPPLELFF